MSDEWTYFTDEEEKRLEEKQLQEYEEQQRLLEGIPEATEDEIGPEIVELWEREDELSVWFGSEERDRRAFSDFLSPWQDGVLLAHCESEDVLNTFANDVIGVLSPGANQMSLGEYLTYDEKDEADRRLAVVNAADIANGDLEGYDPEELASGFLQPKARKLLVVGVSEKIESLKSFLAERNVPFGVVQLRGLDSEDLFISFLSSLEQLTGRHAKEWYEDSFKEEFIEWIEFNYDGLPLKGRMLAQELAEYCIGHPSHELPPQRLERTAITPALFRNGYVEEELERYYDYAKYVRRARNTGRRYIRGNFNTIIHGTLGTGKTTIANSLLEILVGCGLASPQHVERVNALDLIRGEIGESRKATKEQAIASLGGAFVVSGLEIITESAYATQGMEIISVFVEMARLHPDEFILILECSSTGFARLWGNNPDLAACMGWNIETLSLPSKALACITMNKVFSQAAIKPDKATFDEMNEQLEKLFDHFDMSPAAGGGYLAARVANEIVSEHLARVGSFGASFTAEDIPDRSRVCELLGIPSQFRRKEELRRTALHEAGHAVCRAAVAGVGALASISIDEKASGVLGAVASSRHNGGSKEIEDELVVKFGGKAAEWCFFDGVTFGGAKADIESATYLAREYVTRYGMGSTTLAYYSGDIPLSMLPQEVRDQIEELLHNAYESAKNIVSENKELIEGLAEVLLQRTIIRQRPDGDISRVFEEYGWEEDRGEGDVRG